MVHRPPVLCYVQLWTILINASNQQRHTKGPTHDTLLSISTLSESQREITDCLRTALDAQRLIVMERVVLGFGAGVLNHAAGVGLEPGHGAADVVVDFDNLFHRGGLEEAGGDALFDAEYYAFGGGDLEWERWDVSRQSHSKIAHE